MDIRWNISPYPQVTDWSLPAVMPGESREFADASGLSTDVWGDTQPKNASNQSGGTFDAKDKKDAAPEGAPKDADPVVDAPAPEGDK